MLTLNPAAADYGRVEDMCSSSLVRTPKLQLAAEQPSTGEWLIPSKKDIPHRKAKEKP